MIARKTSRDPKDPTRRTGSEWLEVVEPLLVVAWTTEVLVLEASTLEEVDP